MGWFIGAVVVILLFYCWVDTINNKYNLTSKIEYEPEPKFEDQFEYYDSYLVEVITEDLEERALIKMLADCIVAVDYYKIEDPKKVKYYEYCVQLCEEKLARIRSEQTTNEEETTA